MLQFARNLVKGFSKLEKVLIVAFLLLSLFCTGLFIHDMHRPTPKPIYIEKLVPTKEVKIDGKTHQQFAEVTTTRQQMKDVTKQAKKELKAHSIESESIVVDQVDTNYKNSSGMVMPNDTISIKRYTTKKWFLAPIEHKVDIEHSDTAIHSTFANSLSYKEPKVLVCFGPLLGYDPLNRRLVYGLGATFNVISIKSKR